jgi:predicted Zn-dependent protease
MEKVMKKTRHLRISDRDMCNLREADGWVLLENYREALSVLDTVDQKSQLSLQVLSRRWQIFCKEQKYERALHVAETLCIVLPSMAEGWICLANTTRKIRGLKQALDVLHCARRRFPKNSTILYNMACYATQLGRIREGRRWFNKSWQLETSARLRRESFRDPDLWPLWPKGVNKKHLMKV